MGLLDDSVLEGKMKEGSLVLLNLNHQSVVPSGVQETLASQVLKQWVEDDEKWVDCEGCQVADQCPILENRKEIS